jgi:hypothetical protein
MTLFFSFETCGLGFEQDRNTAMCTAVTLFWETSAEQLEFPDEAREREKKNMKFDLSCFEQNKSEYI